MKRFAVFASGYGSNLQAIIDALKKDKVSARLCLVVSDNKKAFALKRALKAGIPTVTFDPQSFVTRQAMDRAMIKELRTFHVDFVVLAGYMRILSPVFVKAFHNKILNIHPSLLPSFKGAHAIKDAFDYGVRSTGVTVHLVDEKVDHGPILAQEALSIRAKDTLRTLEARIHRTEHKMYPKIIDLFAKGKISTRRLAA
ncbi:MAG TPA: phosphoribosylglycinamide formyltransferase [Candidatus Omnitrophota bacterium]|nr:phosphoribosylglycinamide formyltransferase [Candidatus Omnitrophota bacterium]HQL40856.1 phosphoribosylglycinamide formyltransferase [Candidatus Omnitrophota bacterium]